LNKGEVLKELNKMLSDIEDKRGKLIQPEKPSIMQREDIRKWETHLITWWIQQAQSDLLCKLIHGGAGQLNNGIISRLELTEETVTREELTEEVILALNGLNIWELGFPKEDLFVMFIRVLKRLGVEIK